MKLGAPRRPRPGLTSELAVEMRAATVLRAGRRVLGPVDLTVLRGERLLVAGPNGAGKTTLLQALLGLLVPSSGAISVLGMAVGSPAWRRERRRVGYVNQESVQTTLPITAREVVEIGLCATRPGTPDRGQRIRRAMERAGCAPLAPRSFRELSGGERQRVSLARCLAQDPELVLLDEPTASLDPAAKDDLLQLLERLNEESGLTVLMATHEAAHLEESEWPVLRLSDGRVEARSLRT
jgi:ABC-type Mn2+/Zn2+ transport system ATPase subunit